MIGATGLEPANYSQNTLKSSSASLQDGKRRSGMRLGNTLVKVVPAVKYINWPHDLKPTLSALPFHV